MSLAQALAAQRQKPGPVCSIARTLRTMPPEDAEVFTDALGSDVITHASLSRALRSEGYDVGRDAIARHRNGECACGPV